MNSIAAFEDYFGVKGVGVAFCDTVSDADGLLLLKDVKFCQAVKLAHDQRILLDKDSITCKGARYALGFEPGIQKDLVNALKFKRGVSQEIAYRLVDNIPRITNASYSHICLHGDNPDIFIFYMSPKMFMGLLKVYQRTGNSLEVKLSSVTAMCGDVAAQTFLTGKICISFGCDDSREFGDVADGEIIVGIPRETIEQLMAMISSKQQSG
jgi:uncharacterized protein (DUF169 family)